MSSTESLFEKMDDTVGSINSVIDYLKDAEKKKKTDKTAQAVNKSAKLAGGLGNGGILSGFSLKDISDNIVKLSKGLVQFGIASAMGGPDKFVKFLKDFLDVMTSSGALKNPAQIMKLYEAIGASIKNIGEGLGKFSLGLMLFAIPAKLKITDLFLTFMDKMAALSKKSKEIKMGTSAIKDMGMGMLFMVGSMVLMRFIRPVDLLMAVGVIAVFGLFVLTMGLISKVIKGGTKGMKDAGKAMLEMSAGLVVFTLALIVMRFVQVVDIMKAVLVIGVLALFTYVMGESKDVKNGALAFLIISVSMLLLVFTIKQFETVEWDTIMKASMSIGAIALAVYIVGKNAASAIQGAAAVLIVTAAVGVLGFALKTWQDYKIDNGTLVQVGLCVAGVSAALIMLGMPPWNEFVLLGAAALAVVAVSLGASLWIVMDALAKFKDTGWTEDDTKSFGEVMFAVPFGMTKGFYAAGGPMIMFTAPMIGMLGLSLIAFSEGLSAFKRTGLSVGDAQNAADSITAMLTTMREPLEKFGADSPSAGFWGTAANLMTGGVFSLFAKSPLEKGIQLAGRLGRTISSIASGVEVMARGSYIDPDDKTGKRRLPIIPLLPKVGVNIAAMLDAMRGPIEEYGKGEQSQGFWGGAMKFMSGGLINVKTGNTPLQKGLKVASGLGGFISALSKGVVDIAKGTYPDPDDKTGKRKLPIIGLLPLMGKNIGLMLEALKKPLEDFGSENESFASTAKDIGKAIFTGGLSLLFPGDTPLEKGLRAASSLTGFMSGLASVINTIGTGTIELVDKNGKTTKQAIDIRDVGNKFVNTTSYMLEKLKEPLIAFGSENKSLGQKALTVAKAFFTGGLSLLFPGDTPLEKGMRAAGSIGGLIGGIAEAIKIFGAGKIQDPSDPSGNTYLDVDAILPKMQSVFLQVLSGLKVGVSQFATLDSKEIKKASNSVSSVRGFTKDLGAIIQSGADAVLAYNNTPGFNVSLIAAATTVNGAMSALFKDQIFNKSESSIKSFDRVAGGIVRIANVSDKLTSAAVAMKSISDSLVKVFTSLNSVLESKMEAVAMMLDKLVEIDRIDVDTLQKKIDAYKDYIELVKSMDSKTVEAIKNLQTSQSETMENAMGQISETLKALAQTSTDTVYFLKKIAKNTGLDSRAGD